MSASHSARSLSHGLRAVSFAMSSDVLDAAERLNIDIAQVCDRHLRALVQQKQDGRWRQEHAGFIAAYNATLEAEELPLDEWKQF